jgi:phenylpyruvate tautomerase PptA (4-oxalocrotonate tautomerase family)
VIVTGCVATPGAAGFGEEPGSVRVVVAEHACDDWGWGLQHELA